MSLAFVVPSLLAYYRFPSAYHHSAINADGHHLRHYKRNQRMHHHSGCCVSVAGSVESLSHNSNLVGRGRRYRDHSVQMCIADLNLEMQGRYASSADMTVWSVNAGQAGGHVAGVEKRGSLLTTGMAHVVPLISTYCNLTIV